MAITYFCPAINHPLGGIKVIYRHAEMLSANGIESYIFHPENPNFSCTWFTHKVNFREEKLFNAQKDFVVIPEVWAADLGKRCIENNIRYAIFVQNGYLLIEGKGAGTEADLQKAFEAASLIMSISEDTTDVISLAYPHISPNKIIRIFPNIGEKFIAGEKKKTITFMPRKLPRHAETVSLYLRAHLPAEWALVPIVDRSEEDVADLLAESSIFLSFCDLEGFGLPPLEAAICKNIVVGYTGQGAKEYFNPPIFYEVPNGDFKTFVEGITTAIKKIECGFLESAEFAQQLEKIKFDYSGKNELAHLMKFASLVEGLFQK